jgi:hypothetical protein
MKQGKKRASPGADTEKQGVLGSVTLSDDDTTKLHDISKVLERVELAVGNTANSHCEEMY